MTSSELVEIINKERELHAQLLEVRKQITNAVKEGSTIEVYSDDMFEGAIISKTRGRINITHTEGFVYSFPRPGKGIAAYAASEAGKKGGRPRKFNSDSERYKFHNAKRKERNKSLSDEEILQKIRK